MICRKQTEKNRGALPARLNAHHNPLHNLCMISFLKDHTMKRPLFLISLPVLVALLIVSFNLWGETDSAKKRIITTNNQLDLKAWGILGNGKVDCSAAIQQAVDAKVGTLFFPRGVYRLTKTISIDLDKVGPTSISGDGTATFIMEGAGPAFRFIGTHAGTAAPKTVKDNVWLRQRTPMVDGIEIVGANSKACGIEATGTMQMTFTRVVVRKALHGIHLVKRNRNVIVSECHLYENNGVGLFLDHLNLHQINVCNSHISYNKGGGIVLKNSEVRNLQIGTCDIEGNMGDKKSKPTANIMIDSTGTSVGEVTIIGCTIQHGHDAPNSANIRINGESTALKFTPETRTGNITIADNVLSDVRVNIDIKNSRGVTITGNTIWKGFDNDLIIDNCTNVVLSNNVFDRNPRYHYGDGSVSKHGVVITNSSDCTLSGNHILGTGNIPAALIIKKCKRFNIVGCTILDYSRGGLLLEDVSHSRISDCLIRNDNVPTDKDTSFTIKSTNGTGNMYADNLLIKPAQLDEK